jgi:hypothetical protein
MLAESIPSAKLTEYKGGRNDFMSQTRNPFIKDPPDFPALKHK